MSVAAKITALQLSLYSRKIKPSPCVILAGVSIEMSFVFKIVLYKQFMNFQSLPTSGNTERMVKLFGYGVLA